jgi:hypothetical protein
MVEILTFRLLAPNDASVDRFRQADADAQQTFFYVQPGIRRRTTAQSGDGQWVVLTFWDSHEVADAAAAQSQFPENFSAAAALVDLASISRNRFREG